MNADALIERAIERAVASAEGPDTPPKLADAIRYAVFPGGARVRPQLCLAVAQACGDDACMELASSAAAAIELLHCASLVHDDLPCFDAADLRRGKASVHVAFSESLAVLAGDALIVMAFDTLFRERSAHPDRLVAVMKIVSRAVGAREGIVAGQAWESEPNIDLRAYHRSKTGALFVAAAMAGAAAAGDDGAVWRRLGERLGEAYQIADDVRDFTMDAGALGKPAGQDERHLRPNAVHSIGLQSAIEQLQALVEDAADAVPACDGASDLRALIHAQASRLTPKNISSASV